MFLQVHDRIIECMLFISRWQRRLFLCATWKHDITVKETVRLIKADNRPPRPVNICLVLNHNYDNYLPVLCAKMNAQPVKPCC